MVEDKQLHDKVDKLHEKFDRHIIGDGTPKSGLLGRVGFLETVEKSRTWQIRALFVGFITLIGSLVAKFITRAGG